MTIGTAGVGVIGLIGSLAADRNQAYYSTATYAGDQNSITWIGSGTAGLLASVGYIASDLCGTGTNEPVTSGRIVSTAIRVQYSGTELDKGATYAMWVHPDHNSLVGGEASFNSLGERGVSGVVRRGDEIPDLILSGLKENETQYGYGIRSRAVEDATGPDPRLFPFSGSQPATGVFQAPSAVLMVVGKPGSTYYCEFVLHAEYIGSSQNVKRFTPSHSDPQGFQTISQAGQMAYEILEGAPRLGFARAMATSLLKVAKSMPSEQRNAYVRMALASKSDSFREEL